MGVITSTRRPEVDRVGRQLRWWEALLSVASVVPAVASAEIVVLVVVALQHPDRTDPGRWPSVSSKSLAATAVVATGAALVAFFSAHRRADRAGLTGERSAASEDVCNAVESVAIAAGLPAPSVEVVSSFGPSIEVRRRPARLALTSDMTALPFDQLEAVAALGLATIRLPAARQASRVRRAVGAARRWCLFLWMVSAGSLVVLAFLPKLSGLAVSAACGALAELVTVGATWLVSSGASPALLAADRLTDAEAMRWTNRPDSYALALLAMAEGQATHRPEEGSKHAHADDLSLPRLEAVLDAAAGGSQGARVRLEALRHASPSPFIPRPGSANERAVGSRNRRIPLVIPVTRWDPHRRDTVRRVRDWGLSVIGRATLQSGHQVAALQRFSPLSLLGLTGPSRRSYLVVLDDGRRVWLLDEVVEAREAFARMDWWSVMHGDSDSDRWAELIRQQGERASAT